MTLQNPNYALVTVNVPFDAFNFKNSIHSVIGRGIFLNGKQDIQATRISLFRSGPAMPFLPVTSLITDPSPTIALRARVLIRRNHISSQSDLPRLPKAEGLISFHRGACVWLGKEP
jgi:hypothetical protein